MPRERRVRPPAQPEERRQPQERRLADARTRVEELRQQINYHSYRYHVLDEPEVADFEYDQLVRELERLESERRTEARRRALSGSSVSGFST